MLTEIRSRIYAIEQGIKRRRFRISRNLQVAALISRLLHHQRQVSRQNDRARSLL
jgi:predicted transcriptional regulator